MKRVGTAPYQVWSPGPSLRVPSYQGQANRFRRPPFYRRKPSLVAVLIVTGVLIVAVIDMSLMAYQMLQGRNHLLAGAKTLQANGTSLSTTQAIQATSDFHEADQEFRSVGERLAVDPVFFLLGALPYGNRQVSATRSLADMGVQASRAGELGVQVVGVLLSEGDVGRGSEKKAPGERLLALLKAVDPNLNQIGSTLNSIQADRARIPSSGLLPPISSAVKQFDAKFGAVPTAFNTFRSIEPGLYAILGSAGPRSYVVLQEDPAELRAAGGFIGSLGFLDLNHGKMAPYQSHDVYEVDGTGAGVRLGLVGNPKYVAPPAPIDRFIYPSSWELRDSNWSPDFPTSAHQAQFFYQRETGRKADGIITIDPLFVSSVLGVIGPVNVPETGDTVTAQNFFLKTIERVQLHKGAGGQKSFLTYAGKPILDRLFSLPSRQWLPLLKLLGQACVTRSVQAYFDDPASEALVSQFGCDGKLRPTKADSLMVVDTNLDGNKDDFWVKREFKLDIVVNPDGSARHTLHLHYGPYPRITNITGPYIGWLRVYLPPSAKLVRADGASMRLGSDLGHAVAQGWLEWGFDSSKDVVITYDLDAETMNDLSGSWGLYWQKQAGRDADPVGVSVKVPKNWSLVRLAVDNVSTGSQRASSTLARDREFAFVFRKP